METLIGAVLSLLPERWRKSWFGSAGINWPRAAAVSGFMEGFVCLSLLIAWYLHYIQVASAEQAALVAETLATKSTPAGATGAGMSYAMGLAALTAFALHPLTWVLAYFSIEGVARCLAATLTEETMGTLPLVLVDRAILRSRQRAYEQRVPLVADAVTRGGERDPWALKVESCRPKPAWRPMQAVLWENEYFLVAGEAAEPGTPGRPHVYLLRQPRPGEVYRSVEHFDPEEIVREPEKSPHFLSGPLNHWLEQRRIARLPRVPDIVSQGDGSKGWHLKVESCRPKPMWTPPRTVRYEEVLYKVVSQYESKPPRPFGYTLVCLPPHEAARGVLNYSPDEPLGE